MSKSRKNMLRSSFIMLLVATLALSSATFAWFTSSDTAKVENLQFQTKAADGLLISSNAVDWKSTLTYEDFSTNYVTDHANHFGISETVGTDTKNFILAPLSTNAKVFDTDKNMTFFNTAFANGQMTVSAVEENATAGAYYRFDLYIKNVSNSTKSIQLDLGSEKSPVTALTSPAAGTMLAGKTYENTGIQNAVRMAFVNRGTDTTFAGITAKVGTDAKIWEPNAAVHNNYASTYRYEMNDDGTLKNTFVAAANMPVPYAALKAASTTGLDVENEAIKHNATYTDMMTSTNLQRSTFEIIEIPANTLGKVTVYVWIEGQDVDCNNQESGSAVQFTLDLKAVDATTSTT